MGWPSFHSCIHSCIIRALCRRRLPCIRTVCAPLSRTIWQRNYAPGRPSRTGPRKALVALRCVLSCSRRCLALYEGLVARRTRGGRATLLTRVFRRSSAAAQFCSWLRYCRALMTTTPSCVMRVSRRASRRCFTSSGNEEAATSQRRCIALDTLLTFCPPGPCARTAVISTSCTGTCRGSGAMAGLSVTEEVGAGRSGGRRLHLRQAVHGQTVARHAKAAQHGLGRRCHMGMVAKRLARVHVADVQLNQRDPGALGGIVQRDAGVGVSAGVDDHARKLAARVHAARFVDPVEQRAFVVALVKAQRKAMARAGGGA